MKQLIKKLIRVIKGTDRKTEIGELTETQKLFCEWNAERLGITVVESEKRYRDSWAAFPGGHRGPSFREYNHTTHRLYRVFFDENESEVFDTYRFHGHLHFLRMVSYNEARVRDDDRVFQVLNKLEAPRILDFGCGLAATSRNMGEKLKAAGRKPSLILADILTARRDFLVWWGDRKNIPVTILECSAETPIPELPECDCCIALEVFEHLHDPIPYFERLHESLAPGGILVTNVSDHVEEFMHVSPRLGALRERIRKAGYEELEANRIFMRPNN